MITLYDSVDPFAIPLDAPAVAGYIDGAYRWPTEGWTRFDTSTVKLHITVFGDITADVADVENGDMTPDQAVNWSRAVGGGVVPLVYCSADRWTTLRATFAAHNAIEPRWWIADYDGSPTLPQGADIHQYLDPPASGGHYDLSVISDTLFEFLGGTVALTQTDADLVAQTLLNWFITTPTHGPGVGRQVWDVLGDGERVLSTLSGVTAEQATLLAAIQAGETVDPAALATHLSQPLAAALAPLLPPETSPAQLLSALAAQLSK